MNPLEFADDYIFTFEDGKSNDPDKTHSLDADDNGNWYDGKLIGSNHGVTVPILAQFRGVPASLITRAIMRALTRGEAAQIAIATFFKAVHLDRLPWNAITASIMDFGWGAGYNKRGQYRTIIYMQHMVGAKEDGLIGVDGDTVHAFTRWLANRTIEQAAEAWANVRIAYYEEVIAATPVKAKYRRGWRNRTLYFTPKDEGGWWYRFLG